MHKTVFIGGKIVQADLENATREACSSADDHFGWIWAELKTFLISHFYLIVRVVGLGIRLRWSFVVQEQLLNTFERWGISAIELDYLKMGLEKEMS